MAYIKSMNASLCDWEVRIIIEAIGREAERLKFVCENSDDEDDIADAENDYLEVIGLKERIEEQAVDIFGEQITKFYRELT